MVSEKKISGGCMCGAVRYEAVGEPMVVGYCHCHSCRRHSVAPVVALVIFQADKVHFIQGDRSIYNSSSGVGRGFCNQCGTPLTWEGAWGGTDSIDLHISTLDDPNIHVPDRHWSYEEKIACFEVANELPQIARDLPQVGPRSLSAPQNSM